MDLNQRNKASPDTKQDQFFRDLKTKHTSIDSKEWRVIKQKDQKRKKKKERKQWYRDETSRQAVYLTKAKN